MMSFSDLLDTVRADGDVWRADAGADWRQGRTLYGGASAALCLEACLRAAKPAAPLRSAQISFIGPSAENLTLAPAVLRQGKSATFIGCDLLSDDAIATRAVFCFGDARPSAQARQAPRGPSAPAPDACGGYFDADRRPAFATHFDLRLAGGARPLSGATDPDILVWARHRDEQAAGAAALLALADVPPPAAFTLFTAPTIISTMTWMVDVLDPAAMATGGWKLLRSTAESVGDGYSAQAMTIWDADGRAILAGRQSIAVFG
ncbi:MAG: thioesterase family protein [Hyphomonadaceae bacterium]|nr:thioesterase family protein [Hyphomonadaceae bacterium]